jgi:hypothetical protein
MAFGCQLFPCQTFYSNEQKYYLKMSYYNAIVLWLRSNQQKHKFVAGVEYSPVNTCNEFKNPQNENTKALRQLILSMLRYVPSERPSISEVLNSDYFQYWVAKLSLKPGRTVLDYLNYNLLDDRTAASLYDFVTQALLQPISNLEFSCSKVSVDCFKFIYRLTLHFVSATFCANINELQNIATEQIYAACVSLACKIFFGSAISLNLPCALSKIVEIENIVTANLAYCLPIFFV